LEVAEQVDLLALMITVQEVEALVELLVDGSKHLQTTLQL
jgi:hypothetical protein